ncbi:hypothetical protein [Falsirhodobacter halotolerans]|uniref:hypothetical protein n=1 Tax=Falsirhodobacter halotolerans TaxID=1146892 RepID=UPI001FD54935|nr:hypothetical protein [Falsirhodobacter halotolerans]MCJ8138607.1 hypothetical protein [Falsirhodobacter halotolerans]
MGFTPVQVGVMSLWEFMACLDGYGRANGWQANPGGRGMSVERMRELGIEGI